MNPKLLAMLSVALLGCAGIPPGRPDGNNCGLIAAGNLDTRQPVEGLAAILADRLDAALDATTFSTDPSFLDMTENCQNLVGYRVFVRDVPDWQDEYGRDFRVAGTTSCWTKTIIVGTPESGNWRHSAIVHELFHAMQKCEAIQPPDVGNDTAHAGWIRFGTYDAIERTR